MTGGSTLILTVQDRSGAFSSSLCVGQQVIKRVMHGKGACEYLCKLSFGRYSKTDPVLIYIR